MSKRKRFILIVLFIGVVVTLACGFEAQLQKFGADLIRMDQQFPMERTLLEFVNAYPY